MAQLQKSLNLKWASAILAGLLIASCGSPAPETAVSNEADMAVPPVTEGATQTEQVPDTPPKLVKTAQLSLVVDSIGEAVSRSNEIALSQRGDVLRLEETKPQSNWQPPTAVMELRVPQSNLDPTLEELSQLGQLQSQNISAEDVSNQLVDFQARSRNLRKTEGTLLEIMDRSGSVADVLKVAQELSNVRSQIEQIDAQLKDLQNRVAFSTVTLNLEAANATISGERPLVAQLGQTWTNATRSMGQLTSGLLKLLLWMLVYSPYLAVIAIVAWWGIKRHSRSSEHTPPSD
ncbi:MAG: DUF4349 domain-containing protein [Cyanobacteriota bacterium]|nr:DUF4349 domain-containing protein [Cyanobacteriota bacterium]